MGSLHARVVSEAENCDLVWIEDPDSANAERVASRFGSMAAKVGDLGSVDAVIVAAPTQFHRDIAVRVLSEGKPLLLEKPLADELADTDEIIELSRAMDVGLVCGLLERFNPAVRTAFEIAAEPVHVATVRHSPYVDRIRTGVASDLLIHDLDLLIRLYGEVPSIAKAVFSHAHPKSEGDSEDSVAALVTMPSGRTGELSASRLSQRKIRTMSIVEIDRLIEIDLIRQDITIHRHLGLDVAEVDGLGYRQQSVIEVPVIRHQGEPLALQLQHFAAIVRGDADPERERVGVQWAHSALSDVKESALDRST